MEASEDIVIVGGGISGLATALALHRLGLRSVVLESSERLRVTGVAFTTWTNAWRALDALGVADSLRRCHQQQLGIIVMSAESGAKISEVPFTIKGTNGEHEVRCLKRKVLLETLAKELPEGSIRYSSKVVSIEETGHAKLLHLADGTLLKTKVLIGCDGVNSVVAQWLEFKAPSYAGRSAIRGYVDFPQGHGYGSKFLQFVGQGVRYGVIPSCPTTLYWFFVYSPSTRDKDIEENPAKMKQFVLSNLGNIPDKIKNIIETTKLDDIVHSPLRFRPPWQLLWGNISKDNVCITGDAFHPMTPDLGQGACSALEDAIVLARSLAKALLETPGSQATGKYAENEIERIENGLRNYANERRWRGIDLITCAYVVGSLQQSSSKVISFLRSKILGPFLSGLLVKKADYDCGKLIA